MTIFGHFLSLAWFGLLVGLLGSPEPVFSPILKRGCCLLAIMYTAFRQIDPTMDAGADFSAEYQAAMQMQKG